METASRADGDTRRRVRRGLGIYLAVVVVLSTAIEAFIISRPDIDGPSIAGLMFVPAIASVVARFVLKEDSGILTALTLVVAALVFSRGRWTILRRPAKS
ncbi:MAG TPA: hypothetical protein VFI90_14390 [Rubrobacter sp.]|nr:hypothetical protein [Rubrobacter sp.]